MAGDNVTHLPIDDDRDWRRFRSSIIAIAERGGTSPALAAVTADRIEPRWRKIVAAGRGLEPLKRREAALTVAMGEIVLLEAELLRVTLAAGLAIAGAATRPAASADPGADLPPAA